MRVKKYFIGADSHVLMQDGKIGGVDLQTNNAVVSFLEEEGPWDGYIHLGDAYDMNVLSAHNIGQLRKVEGQRLSDDFAATNAYLTQHYKAAGKPIFHLIEGNHENRIERYLDVRPELDGIVNLEKNIPGFVKLTKFWTEHELLTIGKATFIHGVNTGSRQCATALRDYGTNVFMGHCVSDDTEVLTDSGWKFHTELDENTRVGTLNLNRNEIQFQEFSEKFVYSAEKYPRILNFKNDHVDILVTEDHGMVELGKNSGDYRLLPASALLDRSRYSIPLGGEFNSLGIGLSNDQIRLLTWIAADGYFDKLKDSYRVRWHFAKQRKIDRLSKLLANMSIPFKRYEMSSGTVKLDIEMPTWVNFYISPNDKKLPEVFRLMSKDQAAVLLEEISVTDGSRNGNTIQFSTNKEYEADLVQEIAILHNRRSSKIPHSGGFIVSIHDVPGAKTTFKSGQVRFVENTSNVWCLSVPNGTLVFRRNGKVFITQNTHRRELLSLRHHGPDSTKVAESLPCLCEYGQPYLKGSPTQWQQGFAVFYFWPNGLFNYTVTSIFDHAFIAPSGKYYDGKRERPDTKLILS